jgi:hypothetical protein
LKAVVQTQAETETEKERKKKLNAYQKGRSTFLGLLRASGYSLGHRRDIADAGSKSKRAIAAMAQKYTSECLESLRKILTGTAKSITWNNRIQTAELLLAYGRGKPAQVQAVQHSGGLNSPSTDVVIYNAKEALLN